MNSARSARDTRARLKERWRLASFSATSVTETGSSCCSRSCWRIWRGVSPARMPLRSRPPASRAFYSNAPNSILARDAQYFLDGGFAAQHLDAAVVADRGRGGPRVALDLLLRGAVVDHGAHGVVGHDQLVDARAAAIAAGGVTSRSIQRGGGLVCLQVEEAPLVLARLERLLAVRAQHAHQALRQYADQARGQQERLDAHVAQTRDGAGGGVGVQRREHQVAGEARLYRDLRGLEVTDFADHDHIRILAQDGAQAAGESHLDLGVHLGLADAVDVVLDRILDRHDVARVVVEALESCVERGGLARAGGSGDQQDAVWFVDQLIDELLGARVHAEGVEVELARLLVEDTQYDALAVP